MIYTVYNATTILLYFELVQILHLSCQYNCPENVVYLLRLLHVIKYTTKYFFHGFKCYNCPENVVFLLRLLHVIKYTTKYLYHGFKCYEP